MRNKETSGNDRGFQQFVPKVNENGLGYRVGYASGTFLGITIVVLRKGGDILSPRSHSRRMG